MSEVEALSGKTPQKDAELWKVHQFVEETSVRSWVRCTWIPRKRNKTVTSSHVSYRVFPIHPPETKFIECIFEVESHDDSGELLERYRTTFPEAWNRLPVEFNISIFDPIAAFEIMAMGWETSLNSVLRRRSSRIALISPSKISTRRSRRWSRPVSQD